MAMMMMNMIIDILAILLGSAVGYLCVKALYLSSIMLTERSILRKITGRYYDFEIDEALKEMNLTRAEALEQFKDNK
jgi:hypothetical protein